MASRFFWFLGSLLALLFCLGAALDDLETLGKMERDVRRYNSIRDTTQFAVLYLPDRDVRRLVCHEIRFNNPGEIDGYCSFAKVFWDLYYEKDYEETTRHAEWQLIHTALRTMLWERKDCPKELYLYTYKAPDYNIDRRELGYTCTQAIVYEIPKIFREANCEPPSIVVGFSQVDSFKRSALEGCKLMVENNISEYNLENGHFNKMDGCSLVVGLKGRNRG